MKFRIEKATDGIHKYIGIFDDTKRVPFGSHGMSDYTIHKNKLRRDRYLNRHRAREDWTNPMTAGALSRWILWGDASDLDTNVRDFKKRFRLE